MVPKTKEEAVKYARAKARACMEELNSCAYCTMLALQDTFELEDDNLLKAAGALTGGIGGMADTCGSLIAVTMLIGTVCGAGRNEGMDTIDKLLYSGTKAREFYQWFQEQKGCVNCNQILINNTGVIRDYSDPAEYFKAVEEGVLEKCYDVVDNNVAKAVEVLWDELYKGKNKGGR